MHPHLAKCTVCFFVSQKQLLLCRQHHPTAKTTTSQSSFLTDTRHFTLNCHCCLICAVSFLGESGSCLQPYFQFLVKVLAINHGFFQHKLYHTL